VRRSSSAAIDVRQLFAITCRCASDMYLDQLLCFGERPRETSGPTGGAVLKAGGVPGVGVTTVIPPA